MKETNPKDAVSTGKVPLHLCPDTVLVAGSMAFLEGAVKYGAFNWRRAGVRASVYKTAGLDHFLAWWNGEDIDPDSGLPHLWKLLACVAILVDASLIGKLVDDRPPKVPIDDLLKALQPLVREIKDRHADKHPHQNTAAEFPEMPRLLLPTKSRKRVTPRG
ncbi:MAG TPA: dATP/dGTP diphosphohydrolase domain-containing protein [Planctomycetota bacterium]|nr:dATP/dGTP diphosphohydrolase domain-containing protein [Planctomycetota bacterium]